MDKPKHIIYVLYVRHANGVLSGNWKANALSPLILRCRKQRSGGEHVLAVERGVHVAHGGTQPDE